jgi:hypothetical protein
MIWKFSHQPVIRAQNAEKLAGLKAIIIEVPAIG